MRPNQKLNRCSEGNVKHRTKYTDDTFPATDPPNGVVPGGIHCVRARWPHRRVFAFLPARHSVCIKHNKNAQKRQICHVVLFGCVCFYAILLIILDIEAHRRKKTLLLTLPHTNRVKYCHASFPNSRPPPMAHIRPLRPQQVCCA